MSSRAEDLAGLHSHYHLVRGGRVSVGLGLLLTVVGVLLNRHDRKLRTAPEVSRAPRLQYGWVWGVLGVILLVGGIIALAFA